MRLKYGMSCMKPSRLAVKQKWCGGLVRPFDSTSAYKTSKGVWWRGKLWNNYRIIQTDLDVVWCWPSLAWADWMHTRTSAHYNTLLWAGEGFLWDRQWNWNQTVESELAIKLDSQFVFMSECMIVCILERARGRDRESHTVIKIVLHKSFVHSP